MRLSPILLLAIIAALVYYFKFYKPKSDEKKDDEVAKKPVLTQTLQSVKNIRTVLTNPIPKGKPLNLGQKFDKAWLSTLNPFALPSELLSNLYKTKN